MEAIVRVTASGSRLMFLCCLCNQQREKGQLPWKGSEYQSGTSAPSPSLEESICLHQQYREPRETNLLTDTGPLPSQKVSDVNIPSLSSCSLHVFHYQHVATSRQVTGLRKSYTNMQAAKMLSTQIHILKMKFSFLGFNHPCFRV